MPVRYTVSEASTVTGLPVKAINKAIEKRTVSAEITKSQRVLSRVSLLCLSLESKGLKQFPPKFRREIYRSIAANPRVAQLRHSEAVIIDIGAARREIAARLRELRKAKRMVVEDSEIMGGTPVLRGTRVPVHFVAIMVNSGMSVSEILEGYPSLDEEMIRISPIYAAAVPQRGRRPSLRMKPFKVITKLRKAS